MKNHSNTKKYNWIDVLECVTVCEKVFQTISHSVADAVKFKLNQRTIFLE